MRLKSFLLVGVGVCVLASPSAYATGGNSPPDIEMRLQNMEQELQSLRSQLAEKPEVSSAQFDALQNQMYEQQAAARSAATVTVKKGRPTISSSDGKNTLALRAEAMGDFAFYDRSSVASQAFPGPAANNLQPLRNGFTFRRAQLGVEGKFAGDWGYKLMYEFGGNGGQEIASAARIKEAFITYKGFLDPFTFKIGAAPWPANLSDATSSSVSLFLERPTGATLSRGLAADDGRYGVGFFGNGEIWNLSAFLTGDSVGKGALDGQGSVVTRFAVAPIQEKDSNFALHLGGNLSYVFKTQSTGANLAAKAQNISFSDRPELRVTDMRLINTGSISSDSAYTAGLEAGVSYENFLLQGEYFWYGMSRRNPAVGVTNPGFNAWYVEGSYVLTGEPRAYSMSSASFGGPTPAANFNPAEGEWGAWEVAARFSRANLDYNTNSIVVADRVNGGTQDVISLGVNFYPTENVKFMWGWQNVHAKKANIGSNFNAIYARMQFGF